MSILQQSRSEKKLEGRRFCANNPLTRGYWIIYILAPITLLVFTNKPLQQNITQSKSNPGATSTCTGWYKCQEGIGNLGKLKSDNGSAGTSQRQHKQGVQAIQHGRRNNQTTKHNKAQQSKQWQQRLNRPHHHTKQHRPAQMKKVQPAKDRIRAYQ